MATAIYHDCIWCKHECKQHLDYKTKFNKEKCTKEQNKSLKVIKPVEALECLDCGWINDVVDMRTTMLKDGELRCMRCDSLVATEDELAGAGDGK